MTNLLNFIFLTKLLTTIAIPINTSSNETLIRSNCEDINPLCKLFSFGTRNFRPFCDEKFVKQECPKSCNVCVKYKGNKRNLIFATICPMNFQTTLLIRFIQSNYFLGIKPTEGLNSSVVSKNCEDNILCQYFPSYGPNAACTSPGPFRDLGKQHCPEICNNCQISKGTIHLIALHFKIM